MSVSEIDTFVCARILDEEIKMSIVEYDFKSYLCIYLPKNEVIFWDNNIYIFETVFFVLKKTYNETYIVSKAQYKKPSVISRMISIDSLMSLYSFMSFKTPICPRKTKFTYPTFFDVKDSFMVVLV